MSDVDPPEDPGPCEPWPVRWPCAIADVDEALVDLAHRSAWSVLWALTGRRFGVCEVAEQYRPAPRPGCGSPWMTDDLSWRNGGTTTADGVGIFLWRQPVRSIVEVREFGEVVDAADYGLERGWLVRRHRAWVSALPTEPPPIEVTYRYGIAPPALAELAVGELGCEFIAAFQGRDCLLPSNVVALTRQGVTMELGDAAALVEQNRIGLPLCDALIRDTNPHGLKQRPRITSPDVPRRVV